MYILSTIIKKLLIKQTMALLLITQSLQDRLSDGYYWRIEWKNEVNYVDIDEWLWKGKGMNQNSKVFDRPNWDDNDWCDKATSDSKLII